MNICEHCEGFSLFSSSSDAFNLAKERELHPHPFIYLSSLTLSIIEHHIHGTNRSCNLDGLTVTHTLSISSIRLVPFKRWQLPLPMLPKDSSNHQELERISANTHFHTTRIKHTINSSRERENGFSKWKNVNNYMYTKHFSHLLMERDCITLQK